MDPDFNNTNPGLCPIGALKITLPIKQLQLFIDMRKHSQLDANKINVSYDANVRLKRNFHNPEIGCERKSFQTFVSNSIWTICMENDQICFSVSKLAPKTGPYQHVECSIAEVVKFRFNDSCVIQKKTLNEKELSSLFSKDVQKKASNEFQMDGTHSVINYDESPCSGDNGSSQNDQDKIQRHSKACFDGRKMLLEDRTTESNKKAVTFDRSIESDTETMDDEENRLIIDTHDASSSNTTSPGDNRSAAFDEKYAQSAYDSTVNIDKSESSVLWSKPRKGQISPAIKFTTIDEEKSKSKAKPIVDILSGTPEGSDNSNIENHSFRKSTALEIKDTDAEIIEIDNNDDKCDDKNVDEEEDDPEKKEETQDEEAVKEEEVEEHQEEGKENNEWEEEKGQKELGEDNCKEMEGEEKNNVLHKKDKCTHLSVSSPVAGGSNSNAERVPEKKKTTSIPSPDKFPLSDCFEEEFECDVWNDDLMNVVMMDIVAEAMKKKAKDYLKPQGKGLQNRPQVQDDAENDHVENQHVDSGVKTDIPGKSKTHFCPRGSSSDEDCNQVSQKQTDVAKNQSGYNHEGKGIGHKQLEKGDSPVSYDNTCHQVGKDTVSYDNTCHQVGKDTEWIKIEINPDFREHAVESLHDGASLEGRNSRNQNNSSENEKCDSHSVDLSIVKTEPQDDYQSREASSGSKSTDSALLATAFISNETSDFSNTKKENSCTTSLVANTSAAAKNEMSSMEIPRVKNTTEKFCSQGISTSQLTVQTVSKTPFKLPTILQRRSVPMKVVPVANSAPPKGVQISPVIYQYIPISGLILNQTQTSKQGPNPSKPHFHDNLQMSSTAEKSAKSSVSHEPLKINSSSSSQLRTTVHCGVAMDSSITSVQNLQIKRLLNSCTLDKSISTSQTSTKPKDAASLATIGSRATEPTSVCFQNIHGICPSSSSFMIMKKTPFEDKCQEEEQIISSEKDLEIVWDNLSQTADQTKTLGIVWASGKQGEASNRKESSPSSDGKCQEGSSVRKKTGLLPFPFDQPCTRMPFNQKPCDLEKKSSDRASCSSKQLISARNTLLKASGPKSHQVRKGKLDRKRPSSEIPLAGINIAKMECFWSKKRRIMFTGTVTSFGRIMEKLADRDLDYQIHDSNRLVECKNCKVLFVSEQDFMYHMVDFEIYINKSSCRCKCCKLRFTSHELLNSHFQLHSVFKNKNGSEIILDKDFECKLCEEVFCTHRLKFEHDLIDHSLGQVHANLCSKCNRAFPNRIWLHLHYKQCRPSQQDRLPLISFRCQYCGSEFSEEGHRNHHEESCMKISIHHCPYCGIAMAKLLHMAFHISFVHYEVKMIRCTEDDCSLQFESPLRHMCHRIVDHQAPYVVHQLEESQPLFHCQLCRRSIYSVLELYDHLSSRCSWPQGKWFDCNVCELKFISHKAVACHTCCVHPVEEL